MLLRSTSTPILQAYACQISSPDLDTIRPVSMSLERTSSDGDFRLFAGAAKEKRPPKSCSSAGARSSSSFIKEKEDTISVCMEAAAAIAGVNEDLYEEEKIVYMGGGFGGGVGGGSGGGDGWWNSSGPNGSQHMDEYYQSMIKLYPGDGLLLANYAKFLKEVRGDNKKAEEVCERAILANAKDGNVLAMYGELIWKNHKNGDRAQFYLDQAVQSSPDDCYVVASYARFLWDASEDEENNGEGDSDDEELQFYQNLSQEKLPLVAATSN